MTDWQGNIPPHNIQAEEAVLGAMLLEPESARVAISMLTTDSFYHAAHATIFSIIKGLDVIDLMIATDKLDACGKLADVGGAGYLTGLANAISDVDKTEHYCQILLQKAHCRTEARASMERYEQAMRGELSGNGYAVDTQSIIAQVERRRDLIRRGVVMGVKTGLDDLDDILIEGLPLGFCSLVVAEPKVGKSAFALQVCDQIVQGRRGKVLLISLEMRKEDVWPRIVAGRLYRSGIVDDNFNYTELRNDPNVLSRHPEFARVEAATGGWYIDDRERMNTDQILGQIERHVAKYKINVACIDHLMLIDLQARGESTQAKRELFINDTRAMAKRLNIHIMWICHRSTHSSRQTKEPFNPMQVQYWTMAPLSAAVGFYLTRKRDKDTDSWSPHTKIGIPICRFGGAGVKSFHFIGGVQTFQRVDGGGYYAPGQDYLDGLEQRGNSEAEGQDHQPDAGSDRTHGEPAAVAPPVEWGPVADVDVGDEDDEPLF